MIKQTKHPMAVGRTADAKRVNVTWRATMSSRNFRFLVPIAYGLLVVLVGIFATEAVAVAVTVVGAILLGLAYAMGAFRDHS
jgi:hypothetical protein